MSSLPTSINDRDRSYWNRHARNYDRSMKLIGKPLPRMLSLTREALAGAGEVLEVAAGSGLVTVAIASVARRVVATDYAEAMVSTLQQRVAEAAIQNVECRQADLYALDFSPQRFDAVVAANVLHLVPDLTAAIAALRRVLRPQGKLIVPTFCHDETRSSWFVSRALAITGFPGQRRFTSASLKGALQAQGLHVTRQELIPGLIPITYLEGAFDIAR